MKEYVEYKESLYDMLDKYPILKHFVNESGISFSSELINKYLGEDFVGFESVMTSKLFNKILAKFEEKGYDIYKER
jgi:hypothetical protein